MLRLAILRRARHIVVQRVHVRARYRTLCTQLTVCCVLLGRNEAMKTLAVKGHVLCLAIPHGILLLG